MAAQLYFEGRAVSARTSLIQLLGAPEARDPATRLEILGVLLDVCRQSFADTCLQTYAPAYVELARTVRAANPTLQAEQARRAGYYFDAASLSLDRPEVTAKILDEALWAHENPYNGELYLKRRLLASHVWLAQNRPDAAIAEVDRILSLVASLENPQAARFTVACAVTDVISALLDLGQVERAYGLYKAAGPFIAPALGPTSVDAVVFRLAEGRLLERVGDLHGASRALAIAAATAGTIELDPDTRERLLGQALTLRAAVCAAAADLACARGALADHPLRARFSAAGAAAASEPELAYLAARALVAAAGQESDPLAARAIALAPAFGSAARSDASRAAIRAAAAALAKPSGRERAAALVVLGRRLRAQAAGARSLPGAWHRPGAVEQVLTALALTQVETADADDAFALMQLAGRAGPSFDADALTALGSAEGELERRATHEALRLRARRDRLERAAVQQVLSRAAEAPATPGVLRHDPAQRQVFRDFAQRIAAADDSLQAARIPLSGANLVALKAFQSALAPDEAALSVTPTAGGLAYICVRRGATFRATAAVDFARLRLDTKVLQAALTATHPPSETADAQFPAEAAVRLYDVLLRPFAPCLKDGDSLLWLPNLSLAGVPLGALLAAVPPKTAHGYDLAAADWVVRRHAVSYAGSAAVVLASRRPRANGGGFDFLGVGDPLLTGLTRDGQPRGQAVMRGVRGGGALAELAPLPETRDELLASARGFRAPKVLLSDGATERRFRGELVGAYGFLSFATHGLIRDDLQGLSEPALVLTPVSAADPLDDGLLTASEIADLNLGARFVALSACNTANFDLFQMSQDLPALASAFAVAGTPATLGTLWPVNSTTGQAVVADVFERLRVGRGPARALAEAQRAFLAHPPGAAYRHPRFWAPFVVLGDGAAAASAPSDGGLAVTSIERLTTRGGEVLDVSRTPKGVLAGFISDADADGRHAAGARLSGPTSWRRDAAGGAAAGLTLDLSSAIVVGGFRAGPDGRPAPSLDSLDPADGALLGRWTGDAGGAVFSTVLAGGAIDRETALLVTGEVVRSDGARPVLRVYRTSAGQTPQPVFETRAPPGVSVDAATITGFGGDVILTFTARAAPLSSPPAMPADDYDFPLCVSEPVTWFERRDGRIGALKAAREVRGLQVEAALARGGQVTVGGGLTAACGAEAQAVVLALDADLKTREIYRDDSLGQSVVWSLSALPAGRLFVAASKQTVVDLAPPSAPGARRDIYRTQDLNRAHGGMVLVLDRRGHASPPRMLDSGAGVFVNASDASRPDDILLGGSLGGEAAIFHLSDGAGPRH